MDSKTDKTERQVWIMGGGSMTKRYLTRQASAVLKHTDLVLCHKNDLQALSDLGVPENAEREAFSEKEELADRIRSTSTERIVILLPEDPGTDPSVAGLLRELRGFYTAVIPGITEEQLLSSRTGVPYHDAYYVEQPCDAETVLRALRRNRRIYLHHPEDLAGILTFLSEKGFGRTVIYAGEGLGKDGEYVIRGSAEELSRQKFSGQAAVFLERNSADERERKEQLRFAEDSGAELRAVVRGLMNIRPGECVYMLGEWTAETVIAASEDTADGPVYAVSADSGTIERLAEKAKILGCPNLHTIVGVLPEALGHLPYADAVFLAGEEDLHRDLIQIVKSRNPEVRIIILTDVLEAAARDLEAMEALGLSVSGSEIGKSVLEHAEGRHVLKPEEKTFILSGTGAPEQEGRG